MKLFGKKEEARPLSKRTLGEEPYLREIKPREGYVFHSDYFQVDNMYACILSYFHTAGARDDFGPFWGINRIPSGLDVEITTINFEQICRMGDGWLHDHQSRAESVAESNQRSQMESGTNTSLGKARRAGDDLEIIAQELNDGASYLHVHNRLLVKAPSLAALDKAVTSIERLYTDRFGTVWAAPYTGEQRQELATIFAKNEHKRGKGFYFTSTEFAGSYSLVTHGMEDPEGEYVGHMTGDVNNSAVLFDINGFGHHVVIGSEQFDQNMGRARVADLWGSKLSQAVLLNNHRVVHILLSDTNMDKLGPRFDRLTYRVDMNRGDLNMFEMFGNPEDELSIYPAQLEKLCLMIEQISKPTDAERSLLRGSLRELLNRFYKDRRMWVENAVKNRDRIRIVGIPHREVPKLEAFVTYAEVEYKALSNRTARDEELLHSVSLLRQTLNALLESNGDLFNTITADAIDGVSVGRRVLYDFSGLTLRGNGIAMAQLVNIIGYAVQNLGMGDLVVFHGAELIAEPVREYITDQLKHLYGRGGRVAFLYNNLDKMMDDHGFNQFDKADYMILGTMSDNTVARYQKLLGQTIPADLAHLVTQRSSSLSYIRRGFDNVVFERDLLLIPPKPAKKKRRFLKRGG